MTDLFGALLIGIVAGMRAMTAPAAVSWGAVLGRLALDASPLRFLAHWITPWVFTLFALAEFVTDQLPTTPSRTVPVQFGTRVVTGGLSGGAIGAEVRPLYGNASDPYRCSQLFIAIDTGAFPDGDTFARRVDEQSKRVSNSKRAPGIDRVYAPGELAYTTRQNNAGVCTLSRQTFDSLIAAGKSAGIDIESQL